MAEEDSEHHHSSLGDMTTWHPVFGKPASLEHHLTNAGHEYDSMTAYLNILNTDQMPVSLSFIFFLLRMLVLSLSNNPVTMTREQSFLQKLTVAHFIINVLLCLKDHPNSSHN
jgi:hypothetical protein